jgi:hypothetical protein
LRQQSGFVDSSIASLPPAQRGFVVSGNQIHRVGLFVFVGIALLVSAVLLGGGTRSRRP